MQIQTLGFFTKIRLATWTWTLHVMAATLGSPALPGPIWPLLPSPHGFSFLFLFLFLWEQTIFQLRLKKTKYNPRGPHVSRENERPYFFLKMQTISLCSIVNKVCLGQKEEGGHRETHPAHLPIGPVGTESMWGKQWGPQGPGRPQ